MSDSETLAVYARKAAQYAHATRNAADDPGLDTFLSALPKGGRVLDLGCGPGIAAARMADDGYRVTAFDACPEMVALASAHPGVTARQAGFDDIVETETYDGIWANFSLLHARRADLPRHLAAIHAALRASGLFHIGMKTGTGSSRDSLGRLYTYVTESQLRGLLHDAGFAPISSCHGRDPGLDGTLADWITVLARKAAPRP